MWESSERRVRPELVETKPDPGEAGSGRIMLDSYDALLGSAADFMYTNYSPGRDLDFIYGNFRKVWII